MNKIQFIWKKDQFWEKFHVFRENAIPIQFKQIFGRNSTFQEMIVYFEKKSNFSNFEKKILDFELNSSFQGKEKSSILTMHSLGKYSDVKRFNSSGRDQRLFRKKILHIIMNEIKFSVRKFSILKEI